MKKTTKEKVVKIEEYQCESCGSVYPNETYIYQCAACGKDICNGCLEGQDRILPFNIHLLFPSLGTNTIKPPPIKSSKKEQNENPNKTMVTIHTPYINKAGEHVLPKYNKIICNKCIWNWNHWGKKKYNRKLDELVMNFNEELQHINDQILSEIGSPDLDD